MSKEPRQPDPVPFREAVRVWIAVALQSFGGPAGQIAVMHRILVEEKRWVSESRFLHALNYCMLLPGPEAQQLAVYIGWLLNRTPGGLAAGILFVLPGAVSILALSILYASFRDVAFVSGLFFGLKPAVMAVVVEAVVRIGRRALKNRFLLGIAALAFVAIFFFEVPFPAIVVGAGLLGWIGGRVFPEILAAAPAHVSEENMPLADSQVHRVRPSLARSLKVTAIGLTLWLGPLIALVFLLGREHTIVQEGIFFSKTAVVTFGGAYAVLAYIGQRAVETYGWLAPGEMLDGLGLAETTPGPLIMVVQFVAFLGAYRHPGGLDPLLAGVLGSIVTTWVTFVPCFLWIFLGAPYIEALQGNRRLSGALSAITAAVVGVICNLALWLGLHVLFGRVQEVRALGGTWAVPELVTLDVLSTVLALGSAVALLRFKTGMIRTLLVCAGLGLVARLALGS
jgi:chromate transporter